MHCPAITPLARARAGMGLAMLAATTTLSAQTPTAPAKPPLAQTLFVNARVFDGRAPALAQGMNVLVEGQRIAKVSAGAITPAPGATVIDAQGRTLMPGLIDAHTHLMFEAIPQIAALTADIGFVNLAAGKGATDMLMRGFTSARDVGGPVLGLKLAIDQGLLPGPRIWPSGAMISQSGGHGDFRLPTELPSRPGDFSHSERTGASMIADSPDAVRQRVREQLALGASQIKLMAGGGVSSFFDPIDVSQYTVAEFRAAVEAAENWGTYVTVHAYTPRAVRQALEAGVRVVEHGQLLDEPTIQLMAEKGVWLSLQPFLDDEDATPFPPESANRAKQRLMLAGTDKAFELAKKHKVKTAVGSDTLFDAKLASRRGVQFAKLARWYPPAEVLRMMTSGNAELLALSGARSPYPGKLGVVEEGALADLLLVDGDPIANLSLIKDPGKNFVVIMKDGKVYKNTVR
jgi:imidazolonepropionase-like amidohydrolase